MRYMDVKNPWSSCSVNRVNLVQLLITPKLSNSLNRGGVCHCFMKQSDSQMISCTALSTSVRALRSLVPRSGSFDLPRLSCRHSDSHSTSLSGKSVNEL